MIRYMLTVLGIFAVSVYGLFTANIWLIMFSFAGYYVNDLITKE